MYKTVRFVSDLSLSSVGSTTRRMRMLTADLMKTPALPTQHQLPSTQGYGKPLAYSVDRP